MDEYDRNSEIRELLDIWEWCSRALHVKWKRTDKHRNTCLIGLALAVSESRSGTEIPVLDLPLVYRNLPSPLFDEEGLLAFWNACPTSVLEMVLGCFTEGSPLAERLNRLRLRHQNNITLDKLFKKMTSREERYGEEWPTEGHHPENDFVHLKNEMAPLCNAVKRLILHEHAAIETLAREILAQGPWQMGSLPADSFARKTPESLLNRAVRLKLWRVAQEIRSENLDKRERLEALCNGLYRAITPSVKAAIESQGYTVDMVVDDFLNFDMRKPRREITEKRAHRRQP
jgi:hypothetical protein